MIRGQNSVPATELFRTECDMRNTVAATCPRNMFPSVCRPLRQYQPTENANFWVAKVLMSPYILCKISSFNIAYLKEHLVFRTEIFGER